MTETTSPALRTALAYYQAWTDHDLDQAMSYIADDIVCDAPAGRLEGAAAYRGFMGPFVIKLLQEGVELGLLLQDVGTRRASGFSLQGQMHAFMTAVLLGMARTNPLNRDS